MDQQYGKHEAPLPKVKTTELWPRFRRVRSAVHAVLNSQASQTQRDWSGVDSGIHDYGGFFQGLVIGVELAMNIRGTTVDDQIRYDEDYNPVHTREHYVDIYGSYTSPDGFKGAVTIQINNDDSFEVYYLQVAGGKLRLEQVVHGQETFDAKSLPNMRDQVFIPGTKMEFPMLIEGFK